MLKHRVITGIILSLIVLSCILFLNSFLFTLVSLLIFLIGIWEWSRLFQANNQNRLLLFFVLSFLLILLAFTWFSYRVWITKFALYIFLFSNIWWLLALWIELRYPRHTLKTESFAMMILMGLLVLFPAWLAINIVHELPRGQWWIIFAISLVALADVGAYFTGRLFGKRPLLPKVSPKKTWEGVVGGLATSLIFAAVILGYFVKQQILLLLVICLFTVIFSIIGDLFESLIKRQANVKDSGTILPGHGGILDRIDSATAAMPFFAGSVLLILYP
jgi:phosphatidate cytidylyltransferase